jgi:hypothetical protein
VIKKAVEVNDFKIDGKLLKHYPLKVPDIFENCDNDKSEFLAKIEWIKTVDSNNAKWKGKSSLFSSQLVKASLQGQPKTIEFLEKEFDISFRDLLLVD